MIVELAWLIVFSICLYQSTGWLLPSFRRALQPSRTHFSNKQLSMTIQESIDAAERSYQATTDVVGSLVFQAWSRTTKLIPPHVLSSCENDLKGVMSLFVLASFRKSAEEYGSSRRALEWMLKTADVNSDGELTYIEWFDWLQQYSSGPGLYEEPSNRLLGEETSSSPQRRKSSNSLDPMITKLGRVLGSAMSTLNNYARMTSDPVLLTAAYAAGGMSTGLLDAAVVQSMLGRLNDRVRLIVMRSIAAEATRTVQVGSNGGSSTGNGNSGGLSFSLRSSNNNNNRPAVSALPSSSSSPPPAASTVSSIPTQQQQQVDDAVLLNLKWLNRTIPDPAFIQQAPPIFDTTSSNPPTPSLTVEEQLLKAIDNALLGPDIDSLHDFPKDADLTAMGTITMIEAQLDLADNIDASDTSLPVQADQNNEQQILAVRELFEQEIQEFSRIMSESAQLQSSLSDLDDPQAQLLRENVLAKAQSLGPESKVVLGLAIAIRSARLQNLDNMRINRFWRQQLALETIQVWSPISYQLDLARYTPELEIHSYVHLFPSSFAEFLSWYNNFRPLARKVIEAFKLQFVATVQQDALLRRHCSKIIIQSRLKTPPSAFKKMVRNAKMINQLYDIVGIRIITVAREQTEQPASKQQMNFANIQDESTADTDSSSASSSSERQQQQRREGEEKEEEITTTVTIPPITTTAVDHTQTDNTHTDTQTDNIEQLTIYRIQTIISSMMSSQWEEDRKRFKDYISSPKASGYQSIHTSLVHKPTGIRMELQLRSNRMHWIAEFGSASHNSYKALLLPQSAGQ